MNIALPPDLEAFVTEKVRQGGYVDAGDVVRDALRHLRDDVAISEEEPAALEAQMLECEGPAVPMEWSDFQAISNRVRERHRSPA